jgi:hypothetical protein
LGVFSEKLEMLNVTECGAQPLAFPKAPNKIEGN